MKQELLKMQAALDTLEHLGFTWEGGQQWKPPLGKAPYYLRNVPKYVTADLSNDTMCLIGDHLTHDKDYKVLNTYKDRFLVKDDKGIENWYNHTWFYTEQEEDVCYDDGFENLKYVEPEDYLWDIRFSDYITLIVSDLSKEQLSYMNAVLDTNGQDYNGEDYLTMDIDDRKWFWDDGDIDGDSIIYFNDLFKEIK